MFLYLFIPVPAGINLPNITFSLRPIKWSSFPFIAASVNTLVVSWNEAADKNDSVARDALVIPSRTLLATAGFNPWAIASSLHLSNVNTSSYPPGINSVSPGSSSLT